MSEGKTSIIQLSNYVKPVIREEINKDWVLNGYANSFFDYIIDRYNGSATNAALIDAYIDRIYGKGLSIMNSFDNASDVARILSILSKKDVRKIVSDFELFGSSVGQIRYGKGSKRTVAKIEHLERKMVAPNKINEKGEVDTYWICADWRNTNANPPEPYPAFGTSQDDIEIFEIKPYKAGRTYYADPDYLAGLQYAKLEEEISNFSVNHIMNGLSMGWVMNFNNGIPEEEVQENLERKVKASTTGSNNAGRIIINFNDSKETAPTIEAVPDNANHEQWQFWANEARQQLMVAHRVTTPMLFGIKDNTGLGNNANELKEGSKLLHETTIRPKQNEIIDVLQQIIAVNNISSPLTFIPLEDEEEDKAEEKEEPKQEVELHQHLEDCVDDLIELGEEVDQEDWLCISTEEVDYELEDTRDAMLQLASTGTARPNAKSEQDSEQFKVRYQYAPLRASANSRTFCKKMVNASKIYRKEDIIRMGNIPVNPGWGISGAATYSIWLYKGGAQCHHKWLRKTYVKKGRENDVDIKSPLAEIISTAEARRRGDRTVNPAEVSVRPVDMPNNGFTMDDTVLITNDELTKYSPLGGNIDVDKYSFIIKETQVFVIEKILGTKLYDKIVLDYSSDSLTGVYDTILKNYIQPILIYTVSAEYIVIGSFNVVNAGIVKYRPENTESASQKEIEFLANQQRSKADVYIERLQRFLCDGTNDIPEYDAPQENNFDIDPDRDISMFGGWRLSRGVSSGTNAEREIWRDILRNEGR